MSAANSTYPQNEVTEPIPPPHLFEGMGGF